MKNFDELEQFFKQDFTHNKLQEILRPRDERALKFFQLMVWARKYHPDELVQAMEEWSEGDMKEVSEYIKLLHSEVESYFDVMFDELKKKDLTIKYPPE